MLKIYNIVKQLNLDISNTTELKSFNYTLSYYLLNMIDLTTKTTFWLNFVLLLIGLFVNMAVIAVSSRRNLKILAISTYTIGLAVSDILLLCFPIFLKWLNEFNPELALFKSELWCKLHGYIDISFCSWSAWNIVALTHERWSSLGQATRLSIKEAHKRAILTVTFIPVASLSVYLWYPILMDMHNGELIDQKSELNVYGLSHNISVQEEQEFLCKAKDEHLLLAFGLTGIFTAYIIPFVLICYFNSRIIKILSNRIERRKECFALKNSIKTNKSLMSQISTKLSIISSSSVKNNSLLRRKTAPNLPAVSQKSDSFTLEMSPINKMAPKTVAAEVKKHITVDIELEKIRDQIIQLQRIKNDHSISIMLVVVSFTFVILTFPYQITWLLNQIYNIIIEQKLSKVNMNTQEYVELENRILIHHIFFYTLKDLTFILRNLNFSINFFLYSSMSNTFRKELNSLCRNIGLNKTSLFRNSTSHNRSEYSAASKRRNLRIKDSIITNIVRLNNSRSVQNKQRISLTMSQVEVV